MVNEVLLPIMKPLAHCPCSVLATLNAWCLQCAVVELSVATLVTGADSSRAPKTLPPPLSLRCPWLQSVCSCIG